MIFSETIGRLIGVAHHLMMRHLDEAFAKHSIPITAEQFKLMTRLWEHDGISQQSIATTIGRNRAATGKMIDVLEKNGLITRQPHPTDRRLNLICLTPTGKSIEASAKQAAAEVLQKSTGSLSPEELESLKQSLHRIISNLD